MMEWQLRQIRALKREWKRMAREHGRLVRGHCPTLAEDVWKAMASIERKIAELEGRQS